MSEIKVGDRVKWEEEYIDGTVKFKGEIILKRDRFIVKVEDYESNFNLTNFKVFRGVKAEKLEKINKFREGEVVKNSNSKGVFIVNRVILWSDIRDNIMNDVYNVYNLKYRGKIYNINIDVSRKQNRYIIGREKNGYEVSNIVCEDDLERYSISEYKWKVE